MQQVNGFESSSICHLSDHTIECLFDTRHYRSQDCFKRCWYHLIPVQRRSQDLYEAAGHWKKSPWQIPLLFLTVAPGQVVLCHKHPHIMGIPPQIHLWQPYYNFLSQQFAYHCHCHWGESLAKTHFIYNQRSWHIRFPNPPPPNELYSPNLVHQKLDFDQTWNWIHVSWIRGICWLAKQMGIQQPVHHIKTLVFRFVVDCIANRTKYWMGIFSIEDLLIVLLLLLNLPSTFLRFFFLLNNIFQWLHGKLSSCTKTPAHLKFICIVTNFTETQPLEQIFIWMECNQCYSFNQNLH